MSATEIESKIVKLVLYKHFCQMKWNENAFVIASSCSHFPFLCPIGPAPPLLAALLCFRQAPLFFLRLVLLFFSLQQRTHISCACFLYSGQNKSFAVAVPAPPTSPSGLIIYCSYELSVCLCALVLVWEKTLRSLCNCGNVKSASIKSKIQKLVKTARNHLQIPYE